VLTRLGGWATRWRFPALVDLAYLHVGTGHFSLSLPSISATFRTIESLGYPASTVAARLEKLRPAVSEANSSEGVRVSSHSALVARPPFIRYVTYDGL